MIPRFLPAVALQRRRAHSRRLQRHIRRGCAWVLALLIVLPCTAPFSTCDLAVLLADMPTVSGPLEQAMVLSASLETPLDDNAHEPLLDEESFKDVAVPAATVIVVNGRVTVRAQQHDRVRGGVRVPLLTLRV